jgi:hypothetical protein
MLLVPESSTVSVYSPDESIFCVRHVNTLLMLLINKFNRGAALWMLLLSSTGADWDLFEDATTDLGISSWLCKILVNSVWLHMMSGVNKRNDKKKFQGGLLFRTCRPYRSLHVQTTNSLSVKEVETPKCEEESKTINSASFVVLKPRTSFSKLYFTF